MTLEVSPDAWDGLLAQFGPVDVYYCRGYVDSVAPTQHGRSTYLFHEEAEGAVAFPCIVRELPRGGCDVTTVGYGGPLALGGAAPVARFHELYDAWCAEHAAVSTFVRYHPLYANQRDAREPFRCRQIEGTVAWPLSGDLAAGMHRHHRRLVRRAEAAMVEVDVEVEPRSLAEFRRLYEETMARAEASSFYFFPDAHWDGLVDRLGERVVLINARRAGELVAAVLCLSSPPWLHYYLGATSDVGRSVGASHLALLAAASHGKAHGCDVLHLGSGVGAGGGSLLEFKRRFTDAPLLAQWLGKAVHDVPRYLELSGEDSVGYDGFFPAYRRASEASSS